MIREHLEGAIRNIEAEKARALATCKERITREKIIPFNAEIDKSREMAIAELTNTLNAEIAALQQKFAQDKQKLVEAGEHKKAEHANTVVSTETSILAVTYDTALAQLRKQIEEIKE